MQKGKLVQNVLGRSLEPYGFTYEGYRDRRWTLKKVNENNVEHNIVVYKSAYDSSVRLELSTSIQGRYLDDNQELVKQFIDYSDNNEFTNVLKMYSDFIIKYGLSKLDEMSVPLFLFEPTEAMYIELFNNSIQLADNFIKKNNLESSIKIGDSFAIIESIVLNQDREKFDNDVQLALLEITAFFSNKILSEYGGKWEWNDDSKRCFVTNISGKRQQLDFLIWFIQAWEKNECDSLKARYYFISGTW